MSWFRRLVLFGATAAAVMGGASAGAQMRQDVMSDPEGDATALRLMPLYEVLAHNRIFSLPERRASGEGRPITDLTRDDVCGCYYAEGGVGVNAEQCEPVRKTLNENLARIGVVRVIDYDTMRRTLLPNADAVREMSVTSALGKLDRAERNRLQRRMREALADPHLMILAPLPVAHRLMGMRVSSPQDGKQPWETCDVTVGDGVFSPPKVLDGFFARGMLYAARKYGVDVGYPLGTLEKVSAANPPSAWEIGRNVLIARYLAPYGANPLIPFPEIADTRRKKR